MGVRSAYRHSALLAAAAGLSFISAAPTRAAVTTLLNDSWTDGDRTNANLPTDSPVYIGHSATDGSAITSPMSPGHLNLTLGTSSLKIWTYFTSNQSAPDANQPHNGVTTLGVGDSLTASATFSVTGVTTTTNKNFRIGLFFDPSDARVQSDTNGDGGGTGNPWTDALGYAIELPVTATSNSSPFQIVKRTTSNSSLLGSSGAFTNAPTGGSLYNLANNTSYTVKMTLTEVSASDMQVDVSLLQGSTLLASQTVHDLGTSFGGTAVPSGLLSGSQGIYTKFDQLFIRDSDNSQSATVDFTNFSVTLTPAPEPTSLSLLAAAALPLLRRRRAQR